MARGNDKDVRNLLDNVEDEALVRLAKLNNISIDQKDIRILKVEVAGCYADLKSISRDIYIDDISPMFVLRNSSEDSTYNRLRALRPDLFDDAETDREESSDSSSPTPYTGPYAALTGVKPKLDRDQKISATWIVLKSAVYSLLSGIVVTFITVLLLENFASSKQIGDSKIFQVFCASFLAVIAFLSFRKMMIGDMQCQNCGKHYAVREVDKQEELIFAIPKEFIRKSGGHVTEEQWTDVRYKVFKTMQCDGCSHGYIIESIETRREDFRSQVLY